MKRNTVKITAKLVNNLYYDKQDKTVENLA